MREYIEVVRKLIELPRNELRYKVFKSNDKELEKILNNYEIAYHRSCLKIEEYIDKELKDRGLTQCD